MHWCRRPYVCTRRILLVILLGSPSVRPVAGADVNAIWEGGNGNWSQSVQWSGGIVPDNSTDAFSVDIDGGKAGDSVVTMDVSTTVSNLTIDAGDQVKQSNKTSFALAGGNLSNNGTWLTDGLDGNTDFRCDGLIYGSGRLILGDNPDNRLLTEGNCANLEGHTIIGSGRILDNSGTMHNSGSIIANGSNP